MSFTIVLEINEDEMVTYRNKEMLDYEEVKKIAAESMNDMGDYEYLDEIGKVDDLLKEFHPDSEPEKIIFIKSLLEYNLFTGTGTDPWENMTVSVKKGGEWILGDVEISDREAKFYYDHGSFIYELSDDYGYLCILRDEGAVTQSVSCTIAIVLNSFDQKL